MASGVVFTLELISQNNDWVNVGDERRGETDDASE
jgi:hypothetical protein